MAANCFGLNGYTFLQYFQKCNTELQIRIEFHEHFV